MADSGIKVEIKGHPTSGAAAAAAPITRLSSFVQETFAQQRSPFAFGIARGDRSQVIGELERVRKEQAESFAFHRASVNASREDLRVQSADVKKQLVTSNYRLKGMSESAPEYGVLRTQRAAMARESIDVDKRIHALSVELQQLGKAAGDADKPIVRLIKEAKGFPALEPVLARYERQQRSGFTFKGLAAAAATGFDLRDRSANALARQGRMNARWAQGGGGGEEEGGGGLGVGLLGMGMGAAGAALGMLGVGGIYETISLLRGYAEKGEQYQIKAGNFARLTGTSFGAASRFGLNPVLASRYGIKPEDALNIASQAAATGGMRAMPGIGTTMGRYKSYGFQNGEIGGLIGQSARLGLDPNKAIDIVAAGVTKGNQNSKPMIAEIMKAMLASLGRAESAAFVTDPALVTGRMSMMTAALQATGAGAFQGAGAFDALNRITSSMPDFGLRKAGAGLMAGASGMLMSDLMAQNRGNPTEGIRRYLTLQSGGVTADPQAFQTFMGEMKRLGSNPMEQLLLTYGAGLPLGNVTIPKTGIPGLTQPQFRPGSQVGALDLMTAVSKLPGPHGAATEAARAAMGQGQAAIPATEKTLASIDQKETGIGTSLASIDLKLKTLTVDIAQDIVKAGKWVGNLESGPLGKWLFASPPAPPKPTGGGPMKPTGLPGASVPLPADAKVFADAVAGALSDLPDKIATAWHNLEASGERVRREAAAAAAAHHHPTITGPVGPVGPTTGYHK